MRLAIAAALCTAGPLAAQHRFSIEYPTSVATGGNGNVIPFGSAGPGGATPFGEARWQQLLPARVLPALPCRVLAMLVYSGGQTAEVGYERLTIDMSLTGAAALEASLRENLRAPLTVFERQDSNIAWGAADPTRLAFTRPFPYDGTQGIVIDIQKRLSGQQAHANTKMWNVTADTDLPRAVTGFRALGAEEGEDFAKTMVHPSLLVMRLECEAKTPLGARVAPGAGSLAVDVGLAGRAGSWHGLAFECPSLDARPDPVGMVGMAWPALAAPRPHGAALGVPQAGIVLHRFALPRTPALLGMPLRVRAGQLAPTPDSTVVAAVRER